MNSPSFKKMKSSYQKRVMNLINSFNVTKDTVQKYGFQYARSRKEVYDKLIIRFERKSTSDLE